MENGTLQNKVPYECRQYFALALDPIHVGTGAMRLGRVDMPIMREPGTNLPKIPGTSLAGACRAYAAMRENGKFPGCAGQKGHCGDLACPICQAFGFIKDNSTRQGLAQISDARILFFPIHSLAGPVWVTSPDCLRQAGETQTKKGPDCGKLRVARGLSGNAKLNLGWLLLEVAGNDLNFDSKVGSVPQEILDRAVLASDELFSHVVNDNLEVRTSVSIDPATGAASERALFTYEALPRSTVLAFEVVYKDPSLFASNANQPGRMDLSQIVRTVENGLQLFEYLGVGGMNTRGMGRVNVLGLRAGSPLDSKLKAGSEKQEAKP